MDKAIIYKEWIKTRWVLLMLIMISSTFTIYSILSVGRAITLRGPVHIAQVILMRDVIFIESIRYIPLLCGVSLALAQFVPEMVQKRLKLTLHLPLSIGRITFLMLAYGVVFLLVIFVIQYLMLLSYFNHFFPRELVMHIMNSSIIWFFSGIGVYGLVSMICLEPTWRVRVVTLLLTAGIIRLYFIAPTPQAYDGVLIPLLIFSLVLVGFSSVSIDRFKSGVN